ncbi:unnamed protein product [Angiostrongylus costaricensis]|uniref:PET domain-containing protein n=1 Tax=Angiostrongylus costaricensis TaxID=334426 RepID=A0A158PJJ2_ANGCS|nr:unnamed protein product [Angiostrongylus costaricensis]
MTADIRSPDVVTAPCFPTNPDIHKLGQGKQHVLAHEIGQGSLCRKCDCSGLDLHFWRKLCKNCGCRMDEHDVQLPNRSDHGQIIIGRLFHAKDHFETKLAESLKLPAIGEQSSLHSSTSSDSSSHKVGPHRRTSFVEDRTLPTAAYNFKLENDKGTNKTVTEYSWVPVPDKSLVERYMQALPEHERPIVGSIGEQNRKSRLQYQLPLYDCNVEDARFAVEKDKEVLRRFVENVRKHVIGVGQVKEVTSRRGAPRSETGELDDLTHDIDEISLGTVKCKSCAATIPVGDVGIKTDHGSKSLIFAREYTFAEEKSWHFDHFACFKCDFRLGGHRYMTKNDQPHCIDCYMKYFARSCDTCGEKIGADEKRLNYQDYHWHAKRECFHCRQCDMDLIGKKFLFKDRNLFCSSQCKAAYRNKLL